MAFADANFSIAGVTPVEPVSPVLLTEDDEEEVLDDEEDVCSCRLAPRLLKFHA